MINNICHDRLLLPDFKNVRLYEKIKHLVEVDDDILAVLMVTQSQEKDLYIASNSKLDPSEVVLLYERMVVGSYPFENSVETDYDLTRFSRLTGNLRWIVIECQLMRILVIFEQDIKTMVLIRSNTHLENTVGNILGYYYEGDEPPENLF
ncbi:MAG: hypothetical protein L0H53_04540 [Candidatus Nitrosocosmicus sp.]|nr:hypothetical protein [Candidatus Nitrosocosmicus sp.]MDN5867910.1 hypothetical protein [Candidatus Nitrosocosmicus sp.]